MKLLHTKVVETAAFYCLNLPGSVGHRFHLQWLYPHWHGVLQDVAMVCHGVVQVCTSLMFLLHVVVRETPRTNAPRRVHGRRVSRTTPSCKSSWRTTPTPADSVGGACERLGGSQASQRDLKKRPSGVWMMGLGDLRRRVPVP